MPVVYHGRPPSRLCPRLQQATHVFLRVDAVKRPLTPPYEGPFLVHQRSEKTFIIVKNEKLITVSVDRLKPVTSGQQPPSSSVPRDPGPAIPAADGAVSPVVTASGRVSKPVQRYGL